MAVGLIDRVLKSVAGNFHALWLSTDTSDPTGAIHVPAHFLVDRNQIDAFGEVTGSPTANTHLGRTKAIQDSAALTNTILARTNTALATQANILTADGFTTPIKLQGLIAGQVTGLGSSANVQFYRSDTDPAGTANWAPVLETPVTVVPTTGFTQGLIEPASAWWRAGVTGLAGTNVKISLSGRAGT